MPAISQGESTLQWVIRPRLSGFLFAESFISGVREAQGDFPTGYKCSEHHRFPYFYLWKSAGAASLSGIPSWKGMGRAGAGVALVPSLSAEASGGMLKPPHFSREQPRGLGPVLEFPDLQLGKCG